jgi:DNA polymerase III epsilon subunit-like protein
VTVLRRRRGRDVAGPLALGRRTRLRDVEFAVLDTETNDGDPRHAHVVQVAVVGCTGTGRVLDRWSSYVRPPDGDVGPTEVHGVSFDHVVRAPTFEEVLPDLVRCLRGRVRVAHNLPFDAAVLDRAFTRAGYQPGPVADLDTLALSAAGDGPRGHGLKALCDRHGIPLDGWHDAREDAAATARLLPHLLRVRGIVRVRDLVAVAPSVAGRADWPDPVLPPGVVARVAAERAVPAPLLAQHGQRAARARRDRVAAEARDRAMRVRFRRGEDGAWCVVGPPEAIRPGRLVVPTRRGSTVVDVVAVEPAPDDAGVPQARATVRPVALLRPRDDGWEVHGPADAVRPGRVEAVRDDASTVVVEVGPVEEAGERDGVPMVRGRVLAPLRPARPA